MKPKYLYFLSGANLAALLCNLWVWYKDGSDITLFVFIGSCLTAVVIVLSFLLGLMQEELHARLGPKKYKRTNKLDLMSDEEVLEHMKTILPSARQGCCGGCED